MKVLDDFLKKIGHDKVMHFLGGGFICSLISFVTILQESGMLWGQQIGAVTIGTVFVLIISVIKEILFDDKPDWKDVGAAMLGCLWVYAAVGIGTWFNLLSA
ncbi:MAG: hypothetical protein MSK40_05175 [Parabacteroides sp.]|nr:hypothetical protein [Parabacteroides sp.]